MRSPQAWRSSWTRASSSSWPTGFSQSATAYLQLGQQQGFPEEVLAPIRALAFAEEARWEGLGPLPVRAAAAKDKVSAVKDQVARHVAAMRKLHDQLGLAGAENIRLQTDLAAAQQELHNVEALIAAAQPLPEPLRLRPLRQWSLRTRRLRLWPS